MAELRYRWGDALEQDTPGPPRDTLLALVVARRIAWEGDVTEELRAWARWCALQVADLWACSPVVRRWLETGEEPMWCAAKTAATSDDRDPARRATCCALDTVTFIAWANARGAASNAEEAAGDAWLAARSTQQDHLRRLLLRRALPEAHWPLIDRVAIDGDERVLCDALLERCGG